MKGMATKMSSWEKSITAMVRRCWRRSIGRMWISLRSCDCYNRFFVIDGGGVEEFEAWRWVVVDVGCKLTYMRTLQKRCQRCSTRAVKARLCGLRGVRQIVCFYRHVRCNSRYNSMVLVAAVSVKPKFDNQVTIIRIIFSSVTFSQELR